LAAGNFENPEKKTQTLRRDKKDEKRTRRRSAKEMKGEITQNEEAE